MTKKTLQNVQGRIRMAEVNINAFENLVDAAQTDAERELWEEQRQRWIKFLQDCETFLEQNMPDRPRV